jgi:hypothetical protein
MKRSQLLFFAFILISTLSFQSCRTMGGVRAPVYMPPIVDVPDHIQEVAVINRTQPKDNKGKQTLNTIEGILTGEGLFEDREGAKACMAGAATHLNMDTFVNAQVMDTLMIPGMGSGVMAAPLDWALVDTICGKYGKDALLVLEVFDTDQDGSVTSQAVGEIATTIITGGQHKPRIPRSSGNQRVRVKMAWRLYDAKTHQILDQVRMEDWFRVFGNSGNPIYDLGEFAKRDAIQQTAFVAGRSYCTRLFPSWVRIYREYFRRKGTEMKTARRMVEVNDWEGAYDVWMNLAERSPKRKVKGRACYNIAVFHEINGRLDQAIQWAQRSYTQHNIRRARDYVRILNRRKEMEMIQRSRDNN